MDAIELSLKASNDFFRSQVKDLDSATRAVVRRSARQLRTEMRRQTRRAFKPGPNSNKSFFKAFKVYDLDATESLGPASYVRAGVPFLHVFESGATLRARGKYLVILTDSGAKLGFKRISKGNTLAALYRKHGRKLRPVQGRQGPVILYDTGSRWVAVYLFLPSVKMPKRLSFYEAAEAIGDAMPEAINRLLGG